MSYVSIDGGGSKCSAIWFDDHLNLLGKGLAGGINLTQTPVDICRRNIAACLDQAFSAGKPDVIQTVYAILVGPFDIFLEELAKRAAVSRIVRLSEPMGCLLAGGLRSDGLLALAGTGSDVFYLSGDVCYAVGGWGPILGDQGSGTWIGQQALMAFVRASDGWGPSTLLTDLVRSEWGLIHDHDLVGRIHRADSPFREVASATRIVGKAAASGDTVARDILREAGHLLAGQMISLINRYPVPDDQQEIILAGGAWKTHPVMQEGFACTIKAWRPDMTVAKAWFEPAMAGVARFLLDKGMDRFAVRKQMSDRFSDYIYAREE